MKIILTGATGFIGQSTTKQLSETHEILAHTSKTCNITNPEETSKKIKDADCIFHAAGTANLKDSYTNPKKHIETNTQGTKNILEACRKNNIPWIIYTSSASVYSTQGTIKETSETNPKSPYGQSKYKAEELIKKYHNLYNIDYTILRYFNIYGKGDTAKNSHIIPSICKNIHNSTPITLTSTGEQSRDFINIKDIAKINKTIIEKKIKNHTINIGTGTGTTINHIISETEKHLKTKAKINYISKETPPDTFIADITKLKKLIGNYTFIDINNGLKEYTKWFLDNKGDKK